MPLRLIRKIQMKRQNMLSKDNLFLPSGYVNMDAAINCGVPFIFLWGGRGTGKTYGFIDYVLRNNIKFALMRRTQSQHEIIQKPETSPFKSWCMDNDIDIGINPIGKYVGGIYNMETVNNKRIPQGAPIGYTLALSTISNVRGFDMSDVLILGYDEFIPERHERPIKGEADALFNAYETINRNRELKGKPPLILICMANANMLANPIFMGLNLVRKAEEMERTGKQYSIDKRRGICMINLCDSHISEAKRDTALYRMARGTQFSEMALSNVFASEEYGRIKSRNLSEYTPVVAVGEITIYKHKSGGRYYACGHKTGTPVTFGSGDIELLRFKKQFDWIWRQYIADNIEFEEHIIEILFNQYFK